MKAVTVQQMRELERRAMAAGTCGYELMRRAGEGAAAGILRFVEGRLPPRHRRRFAVLAGKGSNGGDAWVAARRLFQLGCSVALYSVCPPEQLPGDAREHAEELPPEVLRYVCWDGEIPAGALAPGTVLVDGLLGTGFRGELRPEIARVVDAVNACGLPVVSLDVPSGIHGDTGEGDRAVVADCTLTMGLPKPGLLRKAGAACSGLVRVVDIGLPEPPESFWTGAETEVFGEREAARLLGRRPAFGHKSTFGHALCLAGSREYSGAPCLAAEACQVSGAGLTTLCTPAGCALREASLGLIVRRLGGERDACFGKDMLPAISELLEGKTAVAYGPGIGLQASPDVLELLLRRREIPLVLDADALRILAANPRLQGLRRGSGNLVLTPHPGELQALGEGFGLWILLRQEDPLPLVADAVSSLSGAAVVLKGRLTRVYDARGGFTVNLSGGPALATAGTGDVLAGLTAGLLAQGLETADAARLAAFVHGHAADLWNGPQRSLTADALWRSIPAALHDLSPLA